jgi:hypothetical protein
MKLPMPPINAWVQPPDNTDSDQNELPHAEPRTNDVKGCNHSTRCRVFLTSLLASFLPFFLPFFLSSFSFLHLILPSTNA